MRWLMYARTDGVEALFYDSESGAAEQAIGSPKLKIELNKAGTFDFKIYPMHPMYNSFRKLKTYIRIMLDDFEIFRGRVLQIETTTYKERSIKCEGDLAYLVDSIQPPDSTGTSTANADLVVNNSSQRQQYPSLPAKEVTVKQASTSSESRIKARIASYFTTLINRHNAQMEADTEKQLTVGNVTVVGTGEDTDFDTTSYRDTMAAIDNDLLKYYGGYLKTRRDGNVVYIDYLKDPGEVSDQSIRLGYNLVDLQQTYDGSDVFTRLIPVGDKQLTISSVNGGKNYIQNDLGFQKYGAIYRTESFSGVTSAAELLKLGQAFMAANYKDDPLTLTIKAFDMHILDGSIEMIKLGSAIDVVSEPHDIEIRLIVTAIEYDIQNPENNSYEIGDPSKKLSQKTNREKVETKAATSRASSRGSYTAAAVEELQEIINLHAQNIIAQAEEVFDIQADQLNVKARVIDVETEQFKLVAQTGIVSEVFDPTATYEAGDRVSYNGIAYEFTKRHEPGDWKGTDSQTGDVKQVGSLQSQITVNAGEIASEVTNRQQADGVLNTSISRVEQKADSVTAEVTAARGSSNSLSAKLSLKADSATLISQINNSSESDPIAYGKLQVQPGNVLIKAINGGQSTDSEVGIEADKVFIKGDTTISGVLDIDSNGALKVTRSALIGTVGNYVSISNGSVSANNVYVQTGGSLEFSGATSGEKYTLNASALKDYIKKAELVGNNTLKLTLVSGQIINFSKATSVNGAWSGNKYTVTAKQTNYDSSQEKDVETEVGSANTEISFGGAVLTNPAYIDDQNQTYGRQALIGADITMRHADNGGSAVDFADTFSMGSKDVTSVYNTGYVAGWMECYKNITIDPPDNTSISSGDTLTVNAQGLPTPDGTATTKKSIVVTATGGSSAGAITFDPGTEIGAGTTKTSGIVIAATATGTATQNTAELSLIKSSYTYTAGSTTKTMKCVNLKYGNLVIGRIAIPLEDKTITSNGTYTASSGYDGLGTVTVNVSSGGGGGTSTVRFRKTPSTSGEIWTNINDGTTVSCPFAVAAYRYKWMPVRYNGNNGYIMSEFIYWTNAWRNKNDGGSYTVLDSPAAQNYNGAGTTYDYNQTCTININGS